jgi:membrane-bound metal-dependent hydrolase YbcI (DUF457 family)
MYLPGHLIVSYAAYAAAYGRADGYFWPFIVAATIVDLDHLWVIYDNRRHPGRIEGSGWRTRLHEIYGLIAFGLIAFILWFFDTRLAEVVIFGYTIHYILDFITGETRPFYPVSREKVQIFIKKQKYRLLLEAVMTVVFGGILLWKAYSF